ncbi:MAG TPA: hypothetical protein VM819_20620 [Vicinamibacterales bacterium]|nr:hypothetical protein [Vicinamibacterales bacterium]
MVGFAVTSAGQDRLGELEPMTDAPAVARAQRATTEGTAFLADHPGFPLCPPSDLDEIISALAVEGRALEPLRLFGVADYLESIEGIGDQMSGGGTRTEFSCLRRGGGERTTY